MQEYHVRAAISKSTQPQKIVTNTLPVEFKRVNNANISDF